MKIGRIWRWRREKVLKGNGGRNRRCGAAGMALSWQFDPDDGSLDLNEKGAESMGKPMGTYLTMEDPGLSETEGCIL